jgi:uncharacterized glyoxalase superfamily protein PhnB
MSADAFESMATPIVPEAPGRRFADDLRARLLRALVPVADLPTRLMKPITPSSSGRPAMTQTITPYLCVQDARAALDWYRRYFAATVGNVIDWEGKVGHAELDIAGATFYLSDEAPALGVLAPPSLGAGSSASFVVLVAAVDQFIDRATSGGAVLQRPIEEAHGMRNGWVMDPFGHRWNFGTPLVDHSVASSRRAPSEPYYLTLISPDVERAAAFFGAVLDWDFAEPHNGGRHIVNTKFPMGIRPTTNPFSENDPGQVDLWFTVRDFDDAVDRVRVAGGTVLAVTSYDSGREARCEDDQGVLFRLSEPAPGYDQG